MNSALPQPPSFWKSRIPLPFSIRGTLFAALPKTNPDGSALLPQLPSPCQEAIEKTVQATRLWTGEKHDVARELIAHFHDALESGVSPLQATDDFGDPKVAARAIRAAKIKNRPAAWRAARRLFQGAGVFVAVCGLTYGILAARFYFSSPTISHNYAKELSARTAAPVDQRAYPIYRDFWIRQYKAKIADVYPDLMNVHPDVLPGEIAWDDAQKYCAQFAADIAEVRRATALSVIGAPVTNADDLVVFSEVTSASSPDYKPAQGDENPSLSGVLMPHLGWARMLARSLMVDARVAFAAGDFNRYHQNLLALLGLSRQLGAEPFLIGRLVHIAVIEFTNQEIRRILTVAPQSLSESQLTELAHTLSAATVDTMKVNFDSEKMFMEDWLQRSYTDDGKGDGRLTREGYQALASVGFDGQGQVRMDSSPLYKVISPVVPAVMAGRKEISDTYLRLIAAAEQDAATPRWQRTVLHADLETEKLNNSPVSKARLNPLLVMIPSFSKAIESCEIAVMNCDATRAAIAIEIYHRRAGHYPAALADLVPAVLPSLPIDIWDGKPLKYFVRDGKPVLYTVGSDKVDNGGAYTDDYMVLQYRAELYKTATKDKDWLYLPHTRKAPKVEPAKRTPPSETTPAPQASPPSSPAS